MKKFTLVIAVIFLIASSAISQPAQLAKGNLMFGATSTLAMGGGWGSDLMSLVFLKTKDKYGSETEDDYTTTAWNILPRAGYFIMDDLVAGLEVVASGYVEKDVDDDDTWKESLIAAGPFVRYYYPLESIYPFAEIEALFGTENDAWMGDDDKSGVFLFSISLGAAVPIGDKVSFDFQAGYTNVTQSWDDVETGDDYKAISGGLAIRVGFSVFL